MTFDEVAERIEASGLGGAPEDAREAEAMRSAFARLLLGPSPAPPRCKAAKVGGVEGLVVAPARHAARAGPPEAPRPRVVWFHGGGYVFGAPETHVRAARALANGTGEPVFLPRYRLAPEHLWPAPLQDGRAVARALQEATPPDGEAIVLAGDSAGGHLALSVALALAREGRPVQALALFSPNTDRSGLSDTREANTLRDPMNADEDDRALARVAFGQRSLTDPQVSPLLGDLSLLPPVHLEVGAREVLLGDSLLLAERGRAAGADVRLRVTPEAFHMWQLWTPWLPAAGSSIGRAAAFLKRQLASADQ